MKNLLLYAMGLFLLTLCLACDTENSCTPESLNQYHYNTATGKCTNCAGKEGYNTLDLAQVRLTKNCECVDLSKQELVYLLEGITEQNAAANNELADFNFRGAKMDSAELFFNYIVQSELQGAKMKTLQYGYAYVWGVTDKFTEFPLEGDCALVKDSLSCNR